MLRTTITNAEPEHSEFLAWAVLKASRSQLDQGPFDMAFNLPEEELLTLLECVILSDIKSSCHFSNFLVAELDGQPVGTLSVHDPGAPGVLPLGAALADAYECLRYESDKFVQAMAQLEVVQRCLPPSLPGTWIVEWVAVRHEYWRQGIASGLLQDGLAKGRQRALRQAQVSTYIGNQNAIATYEKNGFKTLRERRDPGFQAKFGVPGIVTLMHDLLEFANAA